jgi:hypothetical protein
MPDAPAFDPSQPFEPVGGGGTAPPFDPSKPFEPVETPSYGALESAGEGYLKGASANWRDEVYGASKASGLPDVLGGFRAPIGAGRLAYEHMTGTRGPATEEYERARDEMRARERAMQQQHPYAFGAGELGGAAVSTLAAPGMAAETAAGRLGSAALTGAGYGAAAGAGEGEGLADTAKGAGTGAVAGAALGTVGAGAAETLSPLARQVGNAVRGWRDPDLEAGRRAVEGLRADWERAGPAFTNEEIAAANTAGLPRALINVGGERTRAIARSAVNTSPEARAAVQEFTQDTFETQSPRIAGFIRHITGGADAAADQEVLERAAAISSRRTYALAMRSGRKEVWNPELERLAQAPDIRQAILAGGRHEGNEAIISGAQKGRLNPFVLDDNGKLAFRDFGKSTAVPDIAFWDGVKKRLQDREGQLLRGGKDAAARQTGILRRQLVEQLDAAVPEYQIARRGAAAFFQAENALEAGQKFVTMTADIGQARRAVAQMGPVGSPERELFARGYASNLADRVERAGDNVNVLNSAFLNSTAARQKNNLGLGPGRANQLEALLRAERIVDRSRGILRGSDTAQKLFEMGLAGGATAGAEGLLNHDFNPSHVIGAALTVGLARRGAQVIDQRVARRVGEMFASQDPAILARGAKIAGRDPAILNALRQATGAFSRGATEGVETAGGQPKQGFEHGGDVYRASGGRVNPANIDHSPTEAQKEAGNYAKDHVSIHGLDIAIENAKGKKREGVGRDGRKWSVTMPAHYGYIKRTTGRDGDHVDVYLGPHIKSTRVYVVDQHDADSRKFDEHKAFIGFGSAAQVRHTYRKAFSDGRGNERLRHLTEMSVDGFKRWLANGDTTKPLKRAVGGRAEGGDVDEDPPLSNDDAALAASMTHWPEQPNPAQPYLDVARMAASTGLAFATGGLKGAGLDVLPDWMNTVGGVFQNPDNQTALGGVKVGAAYLQKPPFLPKPFEPAGVGKLNKQGEPVFGNSPSNRQAVKEGIEAGKSYGQLAEELGTTSGVIFHAAEDLGVKSKLPQGGQAKSFGEDTVSTQWVALPDGTMVRSKGDQPLARTVLSRDASGRPLTTEPFSTAGDDRILEAGAALNQPPSITAYHGSPHDFDRFDFSRIGTGEGAQAYGHGGYFAESEGTAKSYRDSLSDLKDRQLVGTDYKLPSWVAKKIESRNPIAINDVRTDFQGRLAEMKRQLADPSTPQPWNIEANIPGIENILSGLDHFEQGGKLAPPGRMYQVAIKASPEHFLDWDKPLSEQQGKAKDVLTKLRDDTLNDEGTQGSVLAGSLKDNPTAGQIIAGHKFAYGPEKQTEAFRQAGIPGIKYLDQGSRRMSDAQIAAEIKASQADLEYLHKMKGDQNQIADLEDRILRLNEQYKQPQSRNYVVFDDKMIDILKKYGLAGLTAAGAYHFQDKDIPQRARGGRIGGRIPGELTEANKHSHAEVGYVSSSPRAKQRCELCSKFIPAVQGGPACKKVVQPIAAGGWCRRFMKR